MTTNDGQKTIDDYFSPFDSEVRRFAFVVWGIAASVAVLWFAAIIAAPILRANGSHLADLLYVPFNYLCHQSSARSFRIFGEFFAVCARCTGIYFGVAFGFLGYPFVRSLTDLQPLPRVWLVLSPVPTTIDFLLGISGVWHNTHLSRFLTAAVLGVGCAFFLVPGIIEISRYFLRK